MVIPYGRKGVPDRNDPGNTLSLKTLVKLTVTSPLLPLGQPVTTLIIKLQLYLCVSLSLPQAVTVLGFVSSLTEKKT